MEYILNNLTFISNSEFLIVKRSDWFIALRKSSIDAYSVYIEKSSFKKYINAEAATFIGGDCTYSNVFKVGGDINDKTYKVTLREDQDDRNAIVNNLTSFLHEAISESRHIS